MKKLSSAVMNRRQMISFAFGSAAVLGLTACGGKVLAEQQTADGASKDGPEGIKHAEAANAPAATKEQIEATRIDVSAYDTLLTAAPVATDDVIKASEWASRIKDIGKLRMGGVRTSALFSLEMDDGRVRGFDTALGQMLAKYILGNTNTLDIVQTDWSKRETMLQSDQVDAVIASYVITDERKSVISFAGPYFAAHQGVLVNASNASIQSTEDLDGKAVGIMKGSESARLLQETAPLVNVTEMDTDEELLTALSENRIEAYVTEMDTDEELLTALSENRIEAYVTDSSVLMSDIVKHPGLYRLATEFGPMIPYGIGVPLGSDGVAFINNFLRMIEIDGTWEALWNVCIGKRVGIDTPPEPPAIAK